MVTEQQINHENTVNTEIPPAFSHFQSVQSQLNREVFAQIERVSNFLGGRIDNDFMLKKFV